MPTIVNFTIKKDGSGDYTSIKAAVVAQAKNLVAADELQRFTITGTGWDSATPLSETFIDFAGYTTDATRMVEFIVEPVDRHDFTAGSGFVFTISTSFGLVFRSKHVTLEGFEIANTLNTSNLFDTSANATLKDCLVHDIPLSGQFLGDAEFCINYAYASQGGFANTFYNGGTLLNITCIQLGSEGGFAGDIGIANASCTNVALYTDKSTGSFTNYYLCTGDYNAINKSGEGVPGANSFDTMVTGDFVNFAGLDYRSALGGALETSGLGGTFIGGALEVSSGISIVVDSGSYSQVGTPTTINAQLNITTTTGSYLLTGSDVNLTSAKKLITETGSYNLTGTDVTLIYTPGGGGETLIVDSGVYSLAGDEVLLRADLSIIANSDNYSVAGTATPIKYNASIIADSGSYSLVGTDLNLFANYGMIAVSNSYSLIGTSVTLKYSGDTNQVIGTVTAGFAPDLYSAGYKPNTITVTFKE